MRKSIIAIVVTMLICQVGMTQEVAQWRGPGRNGIYPETGLMKEWPPDGPALAWSAKDIGKGFSTAVSDGKMVYITGMKDTSDYLSAFTLSGKLLWQIAYGRCWSHSFPDTRCTPTVDGNQVFVLSGSGNIACIDKNSGKINWSFDAVRKFDGVYGTWGVCESLLLSGDKLFYTPGGPKTTVVALNKNTGETIWISESINDTSAYVSPLLISYGGKNIVVTLLSNHLVGVDADNGTILWKYLYSALSPEKGLKIWPGAPKTNTITPLFRDGLLYITGGYDHVGVMFRLSEDASAINIVWTDTILDCHHGGVVLVDGFIYGANWIDNSKGNWCCLDWKTGKITYEENWFTKGSVIYADDRLYCYEEKNGNVGLVKPGPQKFEVVSSFKTPLGKGSYWAHPSIYNGNLYIRHGDALMAYDIRMK